MGDVVVAQAMEDQVNFPDDRHTERTTVTDGFFEREVYLSRQGTAEFLRDLADQIEQDTQLTLSTDEWEIPMTYREPIEIEVEFSKDREWELEIELEFTAPKSDNKLNVK